MLVRRQRFFLTGLQNESDKLIDDEFSGKVHKQIVSVPHGIEIKQTRVRSTNQNYLSC